MWLSLNFHLDLTSAASLSRSTLASTLRAGNQQVSPIGRHRFPSSVPTSPVRRQLRIPFSKTATADQAYCIQSSSTIAAYHGDEAVLGDEACRGSSIKDTGTKTR
ncbi:hypothetical protein B0H16DRAFT_1512546 [Mycena metata]|uniref:Uncharacterized protein n=1 Tax=Mycena metata TaxID=1033252 RepID=A0AAD7JX46_9AGAR|nr:hypothetical protein B0H16DRAFT_1512546 [Mycena metata]